METATLIVMLALVEYVWFTMRVGMSREKLGIEAPKTVGDERFERLFRIQMNTLEQLVIFIPATYAFAAYVSTKWVWLFGALFIVGRLMYSAAYLGDPKKRAPGMAMTLLANVALVVGVLIALARGWF